MGAGLGDVLQSTGLTTPEATQLARLLAGFLEQGARAVALEASSIGIAEGRLDGCRIDTAIFTNLTRDHLDYHRDMDDYAAAKEALFLWPQLRLAVLNLDDAFGRRLLGRTTAARIIGYSLEGRRDCAAVLHAEAIETSAVGQRFRLVTPWGAAPVHTPLPGRYTLANLLAVAAVLLDRGLPLAEVAECLAGLRPPAGRLECYGGEEAPWVVIDYAHTPDALAQVLAALRPQAAARGGRLVCVFGCGGGRDPGKRPQMGEIAAAGADQVWITSDNPRNEAPQAILAAIRAGAPQAEVEEDRARAIAAAIAGAQAADVVLIAGKGHEDYQEIAGVRRPFSDAAEARRALAAWQARQKEKSCA